MKRLFLLLIITFVFLSRLYSQVVPNSGFENWTNGIPDNWLTNNAAPLLVTVTQSTTAHSGTYSARGDVVNIFGTGVGPVLLSGSGGRGFSISQKYNRLSGYYQFNSVLGDRLSVTILLSKFQGGVAGNSIYLGPAASWTPFNVDVLYASQDVPDTCLISFAVAPPDSGGNYHAGTYVLLDDLNLSVNVTSVNDPSLVPAQFSLEQNYPNPFNPSTKIKFSLPVKSYVSLKLYNVIGKEIAVIAEGEFPQGINEVTFDAANINSGVYFYTIKTGTNFTQSRKMIVLK